MKFKTYSILSSLVPGFLIFFVIQKEFKIEYDKDLIAFYIAIAFLIGYFINTISSWAEDFYFFTWGGKPSNNLLKGKNIWKVRFYDSLKAKTLLSQETTNTNPTNDELFSIAMRYGNGIKDTRIDDFSAEYAFSRALLTAMLIGTIILLYQNYMDWRYYCFLFPLLLIVWLRCKQRGYYYSREVLNVYLNSKTKP
jgi:hypothetical protein